MTRNIFFKKFLKKLLNNWDYIILVKTEKNIFYNENHFCTFEFYAVCNIKNL